MKAPGSRGPRLPRPRRRAPNVANDLRTADAERTTALCGPGLVRGTPGIAPWARAAGRGFGASPSGVCGRSGDAAVVPPVSLSLSSSPSLFRIQVWKRSN